MSDFLGSLAARSLGSAEVVRPRVAWLFEPPWASAPTAATEESRVEREGGVLAARTGEIAYPVAPPPMSYSQADAPMGDWVRAIEPPTPAPSGEKNPNDGAAASPVPPLAWRLPPRPVSPPSMRTNPGDAGGRSTERRPSTGVSPLPDVSVRTVIPSARAASESGLSASESLGVIDLGRRQAAGRLDASLPVPRPALVRPSAPEETPPGTPDARHAGEIGPIPVKPVRLANAELHGHESRVSDLSRGEPIPPLDSGTARSARVLVRPRVGAYSEPTARAQIQPAAGAEPTIQVTIGRVEVRATHPAVPVTPRERPSPAPMSLEEYLRRRAESVR